MLVMETDHWHFYGRGHYLSGAARGDFFSSELLPVSVVLFGVAAFSLGFVNWSKMIVQAHINLRVPETIKANALKYNGKKQDECNNLY